VSWSGSVQIEELERRLPNGFHDALMSKISIDYVRQQLELSLQVLVGSPEAASHEEREQRRPCTLTLSGLQQCAIEAGDPKSTRTSSLGLLIDVGTGSVSSSSFTLPDTIDPAFSFWIYVREWNAFIYVTAEDADLTWLDA